MALYLWLENLLDSEEGTGSDRIPLWIIVLDRARCWLLALPGVATVRFSPVFKQHRHPTGELING